MESIAQKTRSFIIDAMSSYRSEQPPPHIISKVLKAVNALIENDGDSDKVMMDLYNSCPDVEAASMLRSIFVRSRSSWHISSAPTAQIEMFAIPVYGDASVIRSVLDSRISFSELAELPSRSGFFDAESSAVALMKTALPWETLMSPTNLSKLAFAWSKSLSESTSLAQSASHQSVSDVVEELDKKAPRFGTGTLLIPGIRMLKPSSTRGVDTMNEWTALDEHSKDVHRMLWRQLSFRLSMDAGAAPGSAMFGLPASLLASQSISIAWNMVEQVYARSRKNVRISEVKVLNPSTDNGKLSLAAILSDGLVISRSDKHDLFNICASIKDFSDTITRECGATGPDTRDAVMKYHGY